jgi:hypothetical protein
VKFPHFESGVVKIQRGQSQDLSRTEKAAVASLLLDNPGNIAADPDPGVDVRFLSPASIAKATAHQDSKKRQRMSADQEKYINCDYIIGSVAEVERLWSMAKYVLQDHRSSLSPMHLEALLFLKLNSEYWDLETVNDVCKELDSEEDSEIP